jgi:hypothetical protein
VAAADHGGLAVQPGRLSAPSLCACDVNTAIRSFNNLTTTWKATENLTFITDISFMLKAAGTIAPSACRKGITRLPT